MTRYLLDANVLIALTHPEHIHHEAARGWFGREQDFALCPVTEGALVRFMLRLGSSAGNAGAVLERLHAHPRAEFWPDDLSYGSVDLEGVLGHRQVTDAYLAALAVRHGGLLATFDGGLAALRPGDCHLIAGPSPRP